jgi:hypothetical protein
MMDLFSEHGYAYLVEVMSNLSKHTLLITKDRPTALRTLTRGSDQLVVRLVILAR